jgi:hypothetical protein
MDTAALEKFCSIDDHDVMHAIKRWSNHPDKILSLLCTRFLNRQLYKARIQAEPFEAGFIEKKKEEVAEKFGIGREDIDVLPLFYRRGHQYIVPDQRRTHQYPVQRRHGKGYIRYRECINSAKPFRRG